MIPDSLNKSNKFESIHYVYIISVERHLQNLSHHSYGEDPVSPTHHLANRDELRVVITIKNQEF